MSRIPKFSEKNMAKLESHKITNLTSIIGGRLYDTSYTCGGHSGSDTWAWGQGESTDHMLTGPTQCYYGDLTLNSIVVSGPGTVDVPSFREAETQHFRYDFTGEG